MDELKDLERRIRRIEDHLSIVNEYPFTFEDLMEGLDHRTLETIWSGLDSYPLAVAFIGLTKEQLQRVRTTLSKVRWNEITKELNEPSMGEVTQSSVRIHREGILDRVLKLEKMGEIVVARGKDASNWEPQGKKEEESPLDIKGWMQSTFGKI